MDSCDPAHDRVRRRRRYFLATMGTHAVMAFLVGRRTGEVGIRIALGARASPVVGTVVRHGMAPVVVGLVVGLARSLALSRALTALLFGVPPHDIAILGAASAILVSAALDACALPARRATRIDLARALREP